MNIIRKTIDAALKYRQIVFTVTGVLLLLGVYALMKMPRQEFPEFVIRQGVVVGVYPGASSQQVEEQLTTIVENYLFEYKEVNRKKTYSISREGMMTVVVMLNDSLDKNEAEAFWVKLRHGLRELGPQLPREVIALVASNDFANTSAVLLSIESETKTYKELELYVKQLKTGLRKIEAVSKIRQYGLQNEQIAVYIDDAKLASYAVKPLTMLAALKTEGSVGYAGELDTGTKIMPIHIPPRYKTENNIAEQIISADPLGNVLRVKDVALVVREYEDADSYIRVDGKKAVMISLEMHSGNNIVDFGKDIDAVIAKASKNFPGDISINKIADMPVVVKNSVGSFLTEFMMAIFAVILVTMLLLPRRVAGIAAISIPVSVLISLAILYMAGIELQTVSLAALIVVLGMVVDNAIVIIDNHIEKLDLGEDPRSAALESAAELFVPVLSATFIIIASFVPMMYILTGMAGDFIHSFPVTIMIVLSVSLLVAALIVPILNHRFIREGLRHENIPGDKRSFLDRMQSLYDKTLDAAYLRPKATLAAGILSVVLGALMALLVPQELFPRVERNQFAVEIYLSKGYSLYQTEAVVQKIEKEFRKDKRIVTVASFIGSGSPRFHTLYAPNFPSKNYAQLIVGTRSNEDTIAVLNEYGKKMRNAYPEAYVRFKQLEMNLAIAPIEVRISGGNLKELKQTAGKVSEILRKTEGVIWVRDDYEQPLQGVYVDVNEDEANRLGFTKSILGYSLAVGFKGMPLTTIWEGDYPVKVVLRVDGKGKRNYMDIQNQYITSPFLVSSVPLRQLADLKPEWTEGSIVRRNGVRTITVSADVGRDANPTKIFSAVRPQIEGVNFPEGLTMEYGGEYENQMENYATMGLSLLVSVTITFFILLFQFREVKLALLIMMTMPLSIFGAVVGLLVTGYPFGFTAFLGLISLSGVVVRNGIILVGHAETLLESRGHSVRDAGLAAGKRRMRPIFLTSAAAAVGVIPMIMSGSPLWGPLGTVLCFGLLFSMVLTLYVLPIMYMITHKHSFEKAGEGEWG